MQVVSRKLRIGILPATVPRVTDARAHAVPQVGTHSMGRASGSVSQRNEAQGRLSFDTYAPPSLRGYVRIPIQLTSLKPEAVKTLFPRLIDRNNDFWCLPSQPGLDPRQESRQGPQYRAALARVRAGCVR